MPKRTGPISTPHHESRDPNSLEVRYVWNVKANLELAMDVRGLSFRDVAESSGLSVATVNNVWHARGWADLRTIARLEAGLGERVLDDWAERTDPNF